MPEKKQHDKRINPRIKNVEIGILNLREIKIYPLSMTDQLSLTDLINEAMKSFFESDIDVDGENENLIFVSFIVKTIRDNIKKLLKFVTPDEKPEIVMKEIDNHQLSEIVKIVYQDNYEVPVKNVMSLFPTEKIQSVLERQSQQSAKDIITNLKTSTKKATKKEA